MKHEIPLKTLVTIQVWDPSPSSTVAWKLAFSLVTKSLRRPTVLETQNGGWGQGKTLGKPWENSGKMVKPWENQWKIDGKH